MPAAHRLAVAADPAGAALAAASEVATHLRAAVDARGTATLAVSGGTTAALLFDALVPANVPWDRVQVLQVDERIAPEGDPDRNLVTLQRHLVEPLRLRATNVHPMDATRTPPGDAARAYAALLRRLGSRLDVIHLGLGDDGHTASLVPGDRVLRVHRAAVATTQPYKGRRRLTLTYPTIDAAAHLVWLATGAGKADALRRLLAGDDTIPAGRVRPSGTSTVHVDAAARPES